ncbi:hypothetical protein HDR63_00295 [bacterium]|nr:hypothetical protein [bacterium]
MTDLTPFYEFIYDRQCVWHNRCVLNRPAPWTDDAILRDFRFCNVYRELDGGTLAITRHITGTDMSSTDKLLNIIAYRIFNRRDTFDRLFDGPLHAATFDRRAAVAHMDGIDGPLFSNAYLIASHPVDPTYRPHDKHVQVLIMLERLIPELPRILNELRTANGMRGLQIIEQNVPFAGPFLAGQILLDCTYARDAWGAPDIVPYTANDFLIVGPGAHWGLEILFGTKLSPAAADARCRDLYAMQAAEFEHLRVTRGKDWDDVRWQNPDYPGGRYLCLHDIQNCLCEYRKYTRLRAGERAKRRYYKP